MRLWISYIRDLYAPFYPAVMCREENSGFAMTMRETEGSIATVEVERKRTGWDILRSSMPKCAIVSWSKTGAPADAVVLARGRIVGLPEDLFAPTQTVTLECAPADIDERMLLWCQSNLADGPETDFLFSDADPASVDSYLLGRSGSLVVDPATHAVSYTDDLVGETLHDLADVAFVQSSGRGVYDPPVRTYRARLTAEWTQEAEGTVDVAGQVNFGGAIQTLDSGFAGRIASSLSASSAQGWSTAGEVETQTTIGETSGQLVGSTYVAIGFLRCLVYLGVAQGGYGIVRADEDAIRTSHDVNPVFQQYSVKVKRFPLSYAYSQSRRDLAFLALDVPVQDTAAIRDEDGEEFEWSIGDIFADATIPAWEEATAYRAGEQVAYGGRYYECVEDHRSSYFDEDRGKVFRRRVPGINPPYYESTRTYWLRVRPTSIPTRASMTKFLSTTRGERCLRHALLRLRKEGRRRLRAWHVTLEARWENAVDVRITDSVSILVPWDDQGVYRRAVGKVVAVERTWSGDAAPLIRLEIGIPFGLGGTPADGTGDDAYAETPYVEDDYLGASGATDLEFDVSADPPSVPVLAEALSSPGYAVMGADVVNRAADQIGAISEVLSDGAEITEISVRKATAVKLRMRPIVSTSDTLEREIDVVGNLLVTPSGIDLS